MSNLFIENNSLRNQINKHLSSPTSIGQSITKEKYGEKYGEKPETLEAGSDTETYADAGSDTDTSTDASTDASTSTDSGSDDDNEFSIFDEDRRTHYLGNNSAILQYEFDLCKENSDVTKKYQVQLCGYCVNESALRPFLEYFMTLANENLVFPSFTFHCYTNIPVEMDEEYSPEHVYFKNECMKQVATILDIYDHSEHSTAAVSAMYKGFLLKEVEPTTTGQVNMQNIVYVFFDFTGFSQLPPLDKTQKYVYTTLDEMVNVQHAFGYTIDPAIVSLFKENDELRELRDQKNRILDMPKMIYLCERAGSSYKNAFHTEEKSLKEKDGENEDVEFSILDDRIDHPILGSFYLFSLKPFPTQQSLFLIRRFVGFYVKPLYIVKNLTKVIEMSNFVPVSGSGSDKELDKVPMTLGMVIPTLVDYMSKPKEEEKTELEPEEKQAKPEDKQEEEQEQSDEVNPELEAENKKAIENYQEQKEVEEKETLEDAEVVQRELNELLDLENSCTYFHEMVNGTNTAFWMIKSSLHFTEL